MKIRIRDRRDSDTKLRKGAIATKPDHIAQQVINFVRSKSKHLIDHPKISDLSSKKPVTHYLTKLFLKQSPNLQHLYGIIYSTIDRFFDYDLEEETQQPSEQPIDKTPVEKAQQLSLNFEKTFKQITESYK